MTANLGQSIRKGVKWLLVGNVAGEILQFAFGIALARLLVPADFGMIATVQIFTGFVGMLAAGGMGQSLIRAKTADTREFEGVFTLQLGVGAAIYLAFWLIAPWFAGFFENPLYRDLLRVSALSFVLRPFSFVRISWLTREMDFRKRAIVTLISGAVSGAASVAMAALGMGVWGLTLAGLLGAVVSNVLYFFATPLRARLCFDRGVWGRHSTYGFQVTAGDFLSQLKVDSISLIISKLVGPAALGIFNKADSLVRMPNRLIVPPTSQAVFRAMSMMQDDLDKTKYLFFRTIALLLVYIGPCLVGLWWVAEPVIDVLYGVKWLPAAEPLRVLVVVGFIRVIFIPCGLVLSAQNRMTQKIVIDAVGLALAVAGSLIGLRWGLTGVGWGLVVSHLVYAMCLYAAVMRIIPAHASDFLKAVGPALLLNSILLASLAATHHLLVAFGVTQSLPYLAAMVAVGVTTYGCAFLLIPIPALRGETDRWREKIASGYALITRRSGSA